jgi:hypothetical protein
MPIGTVPTGSLTASVCGGRGSVIAKMESSENSPLGNAGDSAYLIRVRVSVGLFSGGGLGRRSLVLLACVLLHRARMFRVPLFRT